MSKKPSTLYLVERVAWRPAGYTRVKKVSPLLRDSMRPDPFADGALVVPVWEPGEGGFPLRAFLDHTDAEQFMHQQEKAGWVTINPFFYGTGIASWTSLDTGRLCDWLLDIGLVPPKAKKPTAATWRTWYNDVRASLTDLHLSKLREALDGVRLHRIAVLTEEETRIEGATSRWV